MGPRGAAAASRSAPRWAGNTRLAPRLAPRSVPHSADDMAAAGSRGTTRTRPEAKQAPDPEERVGQTGDAARIADTARMAPARTAGTARSSRRGTPGPAGR